SGYGGPLWAPAGLRSVARPAMTLAIGAVATLARLTRSAMLEILNQDYVRTARAKGLAEGAVLLRHGLTNALLPVITVLGLQLALLLSGAFVTETVFAWPGVGRLAVFAIQARDFPLVQGTVLVMVAGLLVLATPAEAIAPYDWRAQDVVGRFGGPSARHLLGTDELGRDIFSRILYGARFSLTIALGAVALSFGIGTALGVAAGF